MPRRKKTVAEKVKAGTYRPCRDGPRETPEIEGFPPEKPADLGGAAGDFWDRMVILLGGVVRASDGPVLGEMCWLFAELQRIKGAVAATAPGEKGYNSLLIGLGIVTDKFDRTASRFGLTPSDRAKLRVEQQGPPKAKVATRPRTKLDGEPPRKG